MRLFLLSLFFTLFQFDSNDVLVKDVTTYIADTVGRRLLASIRPNKDEPVAAPLADAIIEIDGGCRVFVGIR